MTESFLFVNGHVFDGCSSELRRVDVLVEGDTIKEVADPGLRSDAATRVDLDGRTLMPGLIDGHIHAYFPEVDPYVGDRQPMTLVAHWARQMLESCLTRGFTSVRDTGGADYGLAMAIERGWVNGPRLYYCGKALSQTGGHGDMRRAHEEELCACGAYCGHLTRVVDGADNIRVAIREEMRRGAHFIKIMGSGGIASTADNPANPQYSAEEVLAAVDETALHGTYVTAHVYPDAAIRRAIELGVLCIEHGSLISEETAALAAERGTAVVPTLSAHKAMARYGKQFGVPRASLDKLVQVEPHGLRSLELLHRAGARVGFGSDLVGALHQHQCTEFTIRREVLESVDILRSATSVNAEIFGLKDQLGAVEPGLLADLIVVDGDPLTDVSLFDEHGGNVPLVMKGGRIVKQLPAVKVG